MVGITIPQSLPRRFYEFKEILRVYCNKLDPQGKIPIIHLNPVFNADNYQLKHISPLIPTLGIREAEDLPVLLEFARFAGGNGTLSELEDYLSIRVEQLINSLETKSLISHPTISVSSR